MDIKDVFEKIGIASESVGRIKLGRGVAGQLSTIAIVVVIVLGALAFRLNNLYVTIGSILVIILFAFFVFKQILKFAHQHPDVAILEGSEFLIYHGKVQLGAKTLPKPPKAAQIPTEEAALYVEDKEEKEQE